MLHHLRLVLLRLALLSVAGVALFGFCIHGFNDYDRCKFHLLVRGEAYRPFMYRVLLPAMVRVATDAIPVPMQQQLQQFVVAHRATALAFKTFRWEPEHATEFLLAAGFLYFALIGFASLCKALARQTTPCAPAFLEAVPFAALLILPAFYRYTNYHYDLPNLFLFTLGLYWMRVGRLQIYLVAFALAVLNKETALLLIIQFFLYYRPRMQRSRLLIYLGLQSLLYLGLKGGVSYAFRGNPGAFVEVTLLHNMNQFCKLEFPSVITLLGILFLMTYRWERKDAFLRCSVGMVLCHGVVLLVVGYVDEFRVWYEFFASGLCLACDTVARLYPRQLMQLRAEPTAGATESACRVGGGCA